MCMIIFKPAKYPFPDEGLFNRILMQNPHGTGILCNGNVTKWDRECFPQEFEIFPQTESVMVHSRIASRGSVRKRNIHPFEDSRLPGMWFAHNGTTAYVPSNDITDSEFFYKTKLVPKLLTMDSYDELIGTRLDMRTAGSRFILWSGLTKDPAYLYGRWYTLDGLYYSHYVTGAEPTGEEDRWWKLTVN